MWGMASAAGCLVALLPRPPLWLGLAGAGVLPGAALAGAMDLGGGPSGVAMACSRQASSQVALAVDLVLSGGATAAGCGCGLEVFLLVKSGVCLPVRISLLHRFG